MSRPNRAPLEPQRDVGRQRVAALMEAAAAVIQERGFEAATMAEIATRAEAKIGSLYRFFPNKEAMADALMRHHAEILQAEYDAIHARAANATPEELADILIDLLVKLHPQARALTALLDSRTDWTEVRQRFRTQTLAGVKMALTACAPHLGDKEAEGAPDQLRLMNRLYLTTRLAPRN
jgi:AcrR family transcriptional regulator